MGVKKQIVDRKTGVITDPVSEDVVKTEAVGEVLNEVSVSAETPAQVHTVGTIIKEYVQNGLRYKRVVTETGTVDVRA